MDTVSASGVSPRLDVQLMTFHNASSYTLSPTSIFNSIPPERVGLNGEYDHNGLAKRVQLAFSLSFEAEEIENLRINQRGAVVVLIGDVPSQRLLNRLIRVAFNVKGATDVEVNGISIVKPYKLYANDVEGYTSRASYAY